LAAQQGAGCAGRRIAFIAFAARLPGKHNMPGDTNILRGHQAVISAIKSFNSSNNSKFLQNIKNKICPLFLLRELIKKTMYLI